MYRVLKPFEFLEPTTSEETLNILSKYGDKAKVLAGGVELVLNMRLRKITPQYVVSLQKIPELDYVEIDKQKTLKIGAMATLNSLERLPLIQSGYPVLFEAIHQIASVQAKTMGTVVGNICSATPASDVASVLLILDARLKIARAGAEKIVPIEDFFVGVHKSILQPDEIVTEISVPPISIRTGYSFLKLAKTRAEISKLNVSTVITVTDNTCEEAKIVLGSVAPIPLRAKQAEKVIKGQKIDEIVVLRAAEAASTESKPITDLWSTVEYRREMIKVLVRRAIYQSLADARKRMGEEQ